MKKKKTKKQIIEKEEDQPRTSEDRFRQLSLFSAFVDAWKTAVP